MERPFTPTVMLHGFNELDEGNNLCRETGKPSVSQEHCDYDANPDGWNVWLRRDFTDNHPDLEPFDDHPEHDQDFDSYDDASTYARGLAREWQAEIEEY